MKRKFLFSLAFLAFAVIISAFTFNTLKSENYSAFPKWEESLYSKPNQNSCSCMGLFVWCSQTCPDNSGCSCSCGWFSCSCSRCVSTLIPPVLSPNIGGDQQIEEIALSIPSISKEQYANWEGLAILLRSLNSKQSNQAYELMVGMVNDAKKKDTKSYLAKTEEITNLFSKFSKEEKELVNHFFASKNTSIRI